MAIANNSHQRKIIDVYRQEERKKNTTKQIKKNNNKNNKTKKKKQNKINLPTGQDRHNYQKTFQENKKKKITEKTTTKIDISLNEKFGESKKVKILTKMEVLGVKDLLNPKLRKDIKRKISHWIQSWCFRKIQDPCRDSNSAISSRKFSHKMYIPHF